MAYFGLDLVSCTLATHDNDDKNSFRFLEKIEKKNISRKQNIENFFFATANKDNRCIFFSFTFTVINPYIMN